MNIRDVKKVLISLPKRDDRRAAFFSQNINIGTIQVFNAIDKDKIYYSGRLKKGQVACKMSHRQVIIENRNEPCVMLIEDDAIFNKGICEVFFEAIKDLPENWDMLYLGAHHFYEPKKINGKIYTCNVALSTVCYIVNKKMYDIIIKGLEKDVILDIYYTNVIQQKYNCYCIFPNLVTQANGMSDIEGGVVNYEKFYNKWQ